MNKIKLNQYIINAFTDIVFKGNPAAVCILDYWLSDEILLKITQENNLSETAFVVKINDKYHLRWFTPGGEIDLCGHATLATAFVYLNYIIPNEKEIAFETLSGVLTVTLKDDLYTMDFPAYELKKVDVTDKMKDILGVDIVEAYMGRDLLCVVNSKEKVHNIVPNFEKIKELDGLLVHVTAKGDKVDCVSRSFAPKCNILEDPVCGSGHCHIVPYWTNVLQKNEILAYQDSFRGGYLYTKLNGNRIELSGKAVLFSKCEIYLDL
jgi:PhzF family phenazine biosynthesis protein